MPSVKIEYETEPTAPARVAWKDVPEGSLVYDHDTECVAWSDGYRWCLADGMTRPSLGHKLYTVLPKGTPVTVDDDGRMHLVDPSIITPREPPLMSWEDVEVGQLVAWTDEDGDSCVGWKDDDWDGSGIIVDTAVGSYTFDFSEGAAYGLGNVFRPIKSITITRE